MGKNRDLKKLLLPSLFFLCLVGCGSAPAPKPVETSKKDPMSKGYAPAPNQDEVVGKFGGKVGDSEWDLELKKGGEIALVEKSGGKSVEWKGKYRFEPGEDQKSGPILFLMSSKDGKGGAKMSEGNYADGKITLTALDGAPIKSSALARR